MRAANRRGMGVASISANIFRNSLASLACRVSPSLRTLACMGSRPPFPVHDCYVGGIATPPEQCDVTATQQLWKIQTPP